MKKRPKALNENSSLKRPKKRFGQNFLVDLGYCSKIVDLAELNPDDVVVEIGPGRGAITRLLAERGCRVNALEIDRDLFSYLSEEFSDAENVNIISADATKFDFDRLMKESGRKLKIVANLPYNVATPILFRLLDVRRDIERMVLMFQKEVANRIVAAPVSKSYGALSIFPQLYSDVSVALKLPPGAFYPPPKIHSAVVVFHILDVSRYEVKDEALLKRVVSAAFSQRRKKLSNSLKQLFSSPDDLDSSFASAGIDPSRRAETLSVEEFCRLSNALTS